MSYTPGQIQNAESVLLGSYLDRLMGRLRSAFGGSDYDPERVLLYDSHAIAIAAQRMDHSYWKALPKDERELLKLITDPTGYALDKSGVTDRIDTLAKKAANVAGGLVADAGGGDEAQRVLGAVAEEAVKGALNNAVRDSMTIDDPVPDAADSEPGAPDTGAQDRYLGGHKIRKLEKLIKEDGINSIEELKTPRGKRAGGYDLFEKPNGDIVVKPKGGAGPGEPTGYNTGEL